jgi:hypothetical protein
MYITLVRPGTGSTMSICETFDPTEAESLADVQARLVNDLPEWQIMEIMV